MIYREFLTNLILQTVKNNRQDHYIEKDKSIVLKYFGISSSKLPTFQAIASELGVTRQCIKQKISSLVEHSSESDIDRIQKLAIQITPPKMSFYSEILALLKRESIITEDINLYGLMNLFKKFDVKPNFVVLNFQIERVTRQDYVQLEDFLIIEKSYIEEFKRSMKIIATDPGIRGISDLKEVSLRIPSPSLDKLKYIVANAPGSWTFDTGENFWYLFETRDNVLVNCLGKIKSQISNCKIPPLAEVVSSEICARKNQTRKVELLSVVEKYLKTSRFTQKIEDSVVFKDDLKVPSLSRTDNLVIDFFKARQSIVSSSRELYKYLIEQGLSIPNANKARYKSPFVFVDRSNGKKKFHLLFIGSFSNNDLGQLNRYGLFKEKLIKHLGSTDVEASVKIRTEQSILRDYLFEKIEYEKCAICSNLFSVKSLVTAHKKKRCNCSENERVDPNIVWSLCKYGCDYLYEEGAVKISDGKISVCLLEHLSEYEKQYLNNLQGKLIDMKWYFHSEQYFV